MNLMKSKKVWISMAILGAIALTALCFAPLFGQSKQEDLTDQQAQQVVQTAQNMPAGPRVVPSNYDTGITWDEAVKSGKPIAVNFYVDWCHYCQKFAPVLDDLRQQYKDKMNFVLINVEDPKNKKLVDDFMISGFPTLYLVNPKNDNRVFLNQNLYSNPTFLKREFDRFLRVNK